jgi:hypothetical protein
LVFAGKIALVHVLDKLKSVDLPVQAGKAQFT